VVVVSGLRSAAKVIAGSRCRLQRCYAQHTDGDDASQAGKQGISFPRKMAEAEGLALIEKWFIHIVTLKKQMQRYKKVGRWPNDFAFLNLVLSIIMLIFAVKF
jgi:hypothetical protein